MPESVSAQTNPAHIQALQEAVSALYFDDGSDFRGALLRVVQFLDPAMAAALEESPKAAFDAITSAANAVNTLQHQPGAKTPTEAEAIAAADDMLRAAGLETLTSVFSSRTRLLVCARELLAQAGGDWPVRLVAPAQALQGATQIEQPLAKSAIAPDIRMTGVARRKAEALIQEGYEIVGFTLEKPGARSAVMFDAAVRWLTEGQRSELMFSENERSAEPPAPPTTTSDSRTQDDAQVQITSAFGQWLLQAIPPGTVMSDPAAWAPRIIEAYQQTMQATSAGEARREAPRG